MCRLVLEIRSCGMRGQNFLILMSNIAELVDSFLRYVRDNDEWL